MNLTTQELLSMLSPDRRKAVEAQLGTAPSAPKREQAGRGVNKLEAEYARHLSFLQRDGQIVSFAAHPSAFRLADRCTYTPDFVVVLPGGVARFDEVKGFERDDAVVKFKVAAEQTGLWFRMVKRRKGEWVTVREYNAVAVGPAGKGRGA
jgi:hypothetical protein